ncbi:WD40 repeat-like protein [Hyphopichia burtonii NRRL Y-1933]|uniref:WD40 repeat-like protein n=1 Tax=Hyphopichia burtonii NRRL Y-1933 TaxID=984485 RepID=A0A1E4RLL7_9ASCO|nr:WD40 repeat-like protein [Hyphopichia burtonii NRRL Y-1933]ODV68158.1 WD40 repeat-like protein [Hyphopichia burtonii NRRL Y-1933]
MGKQYISTVSAAKAHELDVLGLAITNKYTVTVSSDGYANFWDNKQDEAHDPNAFVVKKFISKYGVHHVSVYENIMPSTKVKVVLLAFANFDGSIVVKSFVNDDLSTFADVDTGNEFKASFWCPGFYKNPLGQQDFLFATHASGSTSVYDLKINSTENSIDISVSIELAGKLNANGTDNSFPNSLSVSKKDKQVAIGYTNGDVILYDFAAMKPVYTFHSTDLQQTGKGSASSSIPRVVEFSPGGSILAVARDNQSSGTITLYDVEYGENIGSLTTPSHSSKNKIGGFAHDGWVMGLSFDSEGKLLASCGFDKCVRIWNLESREREATIKVSISDLEDTEHDESVDQSVVSGVQFIERGIRGGAGGDSNEGLCIISFDRAIRWYREAGGI